MLKLNNKGFAIASILYSIMVLFLILLLSILGMLGTRKAVLDKNKKDIINELNHAYLINKIVFNGVDRNLTIENTPDIDVSSILMQGVSAIGSTEQEIISSEYIIYECPDFDINNITDGTYNFVYKANNGGNTIVGSRNVTFVGFNS